MFQKKKLPGFDPQYHSGGKSSSFGLQPEFADSN